MGVVEAGIALGLVSLSYERTSLFYLPVPDTKWYPWIWCALSLSAVVLLIFGKRPRPAGAVPSAWEKPVTWLRWLVLGGLILVVVMRTYCTFMFHSILRQLENW